TYILIQQTAVEFPEARSGAATHAIRTRMASMREHRQHRANPQSPPMASTADQLTQLADLRDRGAITPEEYQAQKEKLLNG
ncbi:MAG: SHOCT domain-containing protein, partial [Solirubrobacteraceae bacterium]